MESLFTGKKYFLNNISKTAVHSMLASIYSPIPGAVKIPVCEKSIRQKIEKILRYIEY